MKVKKGIKISHPNLGWFILDQKNAIALKEQLGSKIGIPFRFEREKA
ncbi:MULTISPECIES: hypothetical protein [unclassified Ensifer]|nr:MULTISPECIES: hypothetical protein [unclassified Ensifer]